jgi:NADPH-dependent ferric siderophore reductase
MEIIENTQSTRRVQRVRHELRRRDVEVVRVEPLGTELVRVTFRGDMLADFVSLGFDDHVKFMFGPEAEPVRRDYTPRAYDRERLELTIDFAIHGDGLASEWARRAWAGQRVVIGGPRGSMIVPTDYDWHLLAGDVTAVPAIARRLEELPTGARAIVVAQVADMSPLHGVNSAAQIELRQVTSADALVDAIRALPLSAGEGYVWCAGEAAAMARVRAVLLSEKAHPRTAMRVAAYWKHGASDYHDELDR